MAFEPYKLHGVIATSDVDAIYDRLTSKNDIEMPSTILPRFISSGVSEARYFSSIFEAEESYINREWSHVEDVLLPLVNDGCRLPKQTNTFLELSRVFMTTHADVMQGYEHLGTVFVANEGLGDTYLALAWLKILQGQSATAAALVRVASVCKLYHSAVYDFINDWICYFRGMFEEDLAVKIIAEVRWKGPERHRLIKKDPEAYDALFVKLQQKDGVEMEEIFQSVEWMSISTKKKDLGLPYSEIQDFQPNSRNGLIFGDEMQSIFDSIIKNFKWHDAKRFMFVCSKWRKFFLNSTYWEHKLLEQGLTQDDFTDPRLKTPRERYTMFETTMKILLELGWLLREPALKMWKSFKPLALWIGPELVNYEMQPTDHLILIAFLERLRRLWIYGTNNLIEKMIDRNHQNLLVVLARLLSHPSDKIVELSVKILLMLMVSSSTSRMQYAEKLGKMGIVSILRTISQGPYFSLTYEISSLIALISAPHLFDPNTAKDLIVKGKEIEKFRRPKEPFEVEYSRFDDKEDVDTKHIEIGGKKHTSGKKSLHYDFYPKIGAIRGEKVEKFGEDLENSESSISEEERYQSEKKYSRHDSTQYYRKLLAKEMDKNVVGRDLEEYFTGCHLARDWTDLNSGESLWWCIYVDYASPSQRSELSCCRFSFKSEESSQFAKTLLEQPIHAFDFSGRGISRFSSSHVSIERGISHSKSVKMEGTLAIDPMTPFFKTNSVYTIFKRSESGFGPTSDTSDEISKDEKKENSPLRFMGVSRNAIAGFVQKWTDDDISSIIEEEKRAKEAEKDEKEEKNEKNEKVENPQQQSSSSCSNNQKDVSQYSEEEKAIIAAFRTRVEERFGLVLKKIYPKDLVSFRVIGLVEEPVKDDILGAFFMWRDCRSLDKKLWKRVTNKTLKKRTEGESGADTEISAPLPISRAYKTRFDVLNDALFEVRSATIPDSRSVVESRLNAEQMEYLVGKLEEIPSDFPSSHFVSYESANSFNLRRKRFLVFSDTLRRSRIDLLKTIPIDWLTDIHSRIVEIALRSWEKTDEEISNGSSKALSVLNLLGLIQYQSNDSLEYELHNLRSILEECDLETIKQMEKRLCANYQDFPTPYLLVTSERMNKIMFEAKSPEKLSSEREKEKISEKTKHGEILRRENAKKLKKKSPKSREIRSGKEMGKGQEKNRQNQKHGGITYREMLEEVIAKNRTIREIVSRGKEDADVEEMTFFDEESLSSASTSSEERISLVSSGSDASFLRVWFDRLGMVHPSICQGDIPATIEFLVVYFCFALYYRRRIEREMFLPAEGPVALREFYNNRMAILHPSDVSQKELLAGPRACLLPKAAENFEKPKTPENSITGSSMASAAKKIGRKFRSK